MEKVIDMEFYRYLDFENFWRVEIFTRNLKTGAEEHKLYKNRDKQKVTAIAKAYETRIMNKASRIYNR